MEGAGIILSVVTFVFTAYFWLVKARGERPNLRFYQLNNFRAVCRRIADGQGRKRLCIQQIDTGGVLIVNHSTRQNSIILFDCHLVTSDGLIQGDWGYGGDDRPPWNVGPESSISFSPACFFEVPEDFEVPDDLEFRLHFITASGKQFTHRFYKQAPRVPAATHSQRTAA